MAAAQVTFHRPAASLPRRQIRSFTADLPLLVLGCLTLLLAACYKRRCGAAQGWAGNSHFNISLAASAAALMAEITLRVLDGADRGRVFENLDTPVTIGREEGNSIQLNDERVSRFHVKIQADQDKIVLTDLESTNGTKVNGEDIQLRILRFGDMISLGRSVLLIGSREQIARRLAALRGEDPPAGTMGLEEQGQAEPSPVVARLRAQLERRSGRAEHAAHAVAPRAARPHEPRPGGATGRTAGIFARANSRLAQLGQDQGRR